MNSFIAFIQLSNTWNLILGIVLEVMTISQSKELNPAEDTLNFLHNGFPLIVQITNKLQRDTEGSHP